MKLYSLRLVCVFVLAVFLCSSGTMGHLLAPNYQSSEKPASLDRNGPGFWIDDEGYLHFMITNPSPNDIYNTSFYIDFSGGIFLFKVDTKTEAFVDYLASGETVEVKSNDPIIEPRPILNRPIGLGNYLLLMDMYGEDEYQGQISVRLYCIFIFWIMAL